MTLSECPLCHSHGSMLEQLAQGALFCNGCARVFAVDAEGAVIHVVPTQHDPLPAKRSAG